MSISNASEIFSAAVRPQSFESLPDRAAVPQLRDAPCAGKTQIMLAGR